MKKIVLALALGAAPAAHAADMAVRMPMKAQPMVAPMYNWTGFYIGAHVGGAFSRADAVTTVTAGGAFSSAGNSRRDAFIGGGQLGYNWQVTPNWVLGIEADVSAANLDNGYTGVAGATSALYTQEIDVLGTVRGRLGYTWNNAMLYATGGYAWAVTDIARTQLTGLTGLATPGTLERIERTMSGYTVGAGLEYGFAPNWSAKAEYGFVDFDRDGVDFPLSARTTTFDTEIHTVKVGLNYRFGGMRF